MRESQEAFAKKGKLVFKGSVKDIYEPEKGKESLVFAFSDRYSIFDWGEMPDLLEKKGEALNYITQSTFSFLGNKETWRNWDPKDSLKTFPEMKKVLATFQEEGVCHHLKKTALGKVFWEKEEWEKTLLEVQKVAVVRPSPVYDGQNRFLNWDYRYYQKKVTKTLVPLEVIFRRGLPAGSSFFSRASDEQYCADLGLKGEQIPSQGGFFKEPIVEFSTKLEATDQYLSYEKAQKIAGLDHEEFLSLVAMAKLMALRLAQQYEKGGVTLWDGKFEFAFLEGKSPDEKRQFMLVDAIGPDELRLSLKGLPLSKEFLRQFYRNGPWHEEVKRVQKSGDPKWKEKMTLAPPRLEEHQKELAQGLYQSMANFWAIQGGERPPFQEALSLEDWVKKVI